MAVAKDEDNVVIKHTLYRVATIHMLAVFEPESIALTQNDDQQLQYIRGIPNLDLQPFIIDGFSFSCDISTEVISPYLPSIKRPTAFEALHILSYPSIRPISQLISSKMVWAGIRQDLNRWPRSCEIFQWAKISANSSRRMDGSITCTSTSSNFLSAKGSSNAWWLWRDPSLTFARVLIDSWLTITTVQAARTRSLFWIS